MVTNLHAPAALGALGDPTRRAIFERLGERPLAVVDLAALVPVSRPAVSQHLKVLREAGLVRGVQQPGNRRVYSLDPHGIAGLRDYLDRFWNTALHSFKTRVRTARRGGPMTGTTAVTTSIVVEAPADQAFTVFTDDIGSWWPAEHHILAAPLATMVFEPRVGGHVDHVGTDGSQCHWARALAYEPPTRVVFSWDISLQWQIETDPARTSEVEVRFVPEGQHRTRVELEHRHIDRHGDGWEGMRDAVGSPEGWGVGLQRFSRRLEQSPVGEA